MALKTSSDWRPGSKRRMIAELAESGATQRETFATLKPLVIDQIEPMVFRANVNGSRQPKSIPNQLIELKHEIQRVFTALGLDDGGSPVIPEDAEVESPDVEIPATPDETPEDDQTDRCYTRTVRGEMEYFLRRVQEIRREIIRRMQQGQTIDNISNRPTKEAKKLIPAGVPADVLILSMTMHWEPDIRQGFGIDAFDFNQEGQLKSHPEFLRVSRWVMKSRGIDPTGKHELFGYVLILLENRVPTLLIGPAGTGKSFLIEQVADFMGLRYAETGMSQGASRGDLLGRHTISQEKPFITAEFDSMFGSGGVFNLEELDRADPGVVIALNNALANGKLYNSVNGEKTNQHANFCVAGSANTFGLGANADYTSAERMDAAVKDRFRMGRLYVPIDENLEKYLFLNS